MIRWNRRRACASVAAAVCAASAVMAAGGPSAGAGEAALVPAAEWQPFPGDTVGHGFVAVDDVARVGYAFSGTADGVWNRVQALDLDTGRPLAKVTPTRALPPRAPVVVDPKRHVLIYAETYVSTQTGPATGHLVGIALRGGEVREIFRVPSPLGTHRVAGMSFDDAGRDLFVVGTLDGAGQNVGDGTGTVRVQRVEVDALLGGAVRPRWTEPVQVPPTVCQALLQSAQPAGVLVAGDTMWIACRGGSTFATTSFGTNVTGGSSAIVRISGLGPGAPAPVVRPFRTPGDFTLAGESLADDRTRRFVLVESAGYIGLRVFDTDHSRYVGRVNAGSRSLLGVTLDRLTSRAYFISSDATVGLGYGDLAARVPTQGERLPSPYSGLVANGVRRRLSFDATTRRLLVPLRRVGGDGRNVEVVMVLADRSDPYRAPAAPDHAAGTVDAVDRAGVTESAIAATSRAYGVDYQLVGGTASLLHNATGVDNRGITRPGTRYLRSAYVKSASLTGDGALAYATTGEEDATTDQDRNQVTAPSPAPSSATAGSRFAPVAECSDYGAGKTRADVPGASVECDLARQTVRATAEFQGDDGVFVTAPQTAQSAPVRAPVQVGKAWTEVSERRGAGRGALVTTISTTAENVTIAGVARLGRVTQSVTVTSHGRTGTAKVERTAAISGVVVGGQDVCGSRCDPRVVQREVNEALGGRGGIDLPVAAILATRRGTYAEITQDPWYHAERVLDYDKANDDYVVPVVSIQLWMDSIAKSRLVVDLAGVSAMTSYRVFPLGDDDFGGDGGGSDGGGGNGGLVAVPRPSAPVVPVGDPAPAVPTPAPAPQAADGGTGFAGGLAERVSLTLRTLREALPLLAMWALLAVPAYLSARRRLLLELPMLTRDEEVT